MEKLMKTFVLMIITTISTCLPAVADSAWKKHSVAVQGTTIYSKFLGNQKDWNGTKYWDGGYEVKAENKTSSAQHVKLTVKYKYKDNDESKTASKTDENDVGVNSEEKINSQNASVISGTIFDGTKKVGDL